MKKKTPKENEITDAEIIIFCLSFSNVLSYVLYMVYNNRAKFCIAHQ